jgi:dipeptidyl aminopeptidase/acylaminoacyl peptidase
MPAPQEVTVATPRIGPEIVSRQQALTGFDLSPDGETIVFARREVVRGRYAAHLWRVPTAGGRPERLTSATAVDGAPRISPAGDEVLFVSDRGGRKQPWVLPLAGGEPRSLTELPDGASSGAWSPDGRRVALVGRSGEERYLIGERRKGEEPTGRAIRDVLWRFDGEGVRDQLSSVWIVGAKGGRARRLTAADHGADGIGWSPDGVRIGFVGDRRPERASADRPQVWSVGIERGAPARVSPAGQVALQMAWGHAGIAWTAWEAETPAWQTIGIWVRIGRRVLRLAPGRDLFMGPVGYGEVNADASGPTLAWLDEDHLVAIASERGLALPWKLGLDGSATCLAPEAIAGCAVVRTAAGRAVVAASIDGDAADLYEVQDGGLRKIPRGTGRWFVPYRRSAERVTVTRRRLPDVDGFLLRAERGRDPRPLVVRPHGGPYDAFGPASRFEDLALAARGYHVLRPNPRGSVSYGEGFAKALHGAWGDPDSEDILAMIDRLRDDGVVDPSRVGVLGLSYGGFMVHWLLANFPERFTVGVSENPFTLVMADLGAGDSAEDVVDGIGLPPWPDGVEAWHDRSPVFRITRSRAPLLLLVAEADLRCPPIHSEIPFTVLRMAGVTAEMVRYPGESHVMYVHGRPDRRIDRLERILDWFGRYL